MKTKMISIFLIVVLIANMVLFALGKVKGLYFWAIIVIIAIIAYKVIPMVKTR